jgi:hypothetical protein
MTAMGMYGEFVGMATAASALLLPSPHPFRHNRAIAIREAHHVAMCNWHDLNHLVT